MIIKPVINMSLIQLFYVSTASIKMDVRALESILKKAHANNLKAQITGMLIYEDGNFMQVLEGNAETVRNKFHQIARDPRHKNIIKLGENTVDKRDFPDWSMGFKLFNEYDIKLNPYFRDFFSADFRPEDHRIRLGIAIEILKNFNH